MNNKVLIGLFGLIFFLSPWYLFNSGSLQPVDIGFFSLVVLMLVMRLPYLNWITQHSAIYRSFLLLSAYIFISLLVNFIIRSNSITLNLAGQNLYYTLIASIFLISICYFYGVYSFEQCYRFFLIFILLSSILPFIFFLKTGGTTFRASLTFNNPNQLGFFALVNLSLVYYLNLLGTQEGIQLRKILSLLIINVNVLFLFLSASRACYPALGMYAISYFIIFKPKLSGYGIWLFRTFAVTLSIYVMFAMGLFLFEHMLATRQSMLPTSYLGLSSDIYYRAFKGLGGNFDHVWDFLFGNGNYTVGGRDRLEFHNNFVAIFSQVGLFGLIIYLYMNMIILRGLYRAGVLYLIPYACYLYYSMFHYSYRTRFNWLFLAFVIFVILYTHLRKERELRGALKDRDEDFNRYHYI